MKNSIEGVSGGLVEAISRGIEGSDRTDISVPDKRLESTHSLSIRSRGSTCAAL
jgi:hypothetical protein